MTRRRRMFQEPARVRSGEPLRRNVEPLHRAVRDESAAAHPDLPAAPRAGLGTGAVETKSWKSGADGPLHASALAAAGSGEPAGRSCD